MNKYERKAKAIVAELFPPQNPAVEVTGEWARSWGESPKSVDWLVDAIATALRESAEEGPEPPYRSTLDRFGKGGFGSSDND